MNEKREGEKIIVSLTSFPRRIGVVWQTIESLLRQELKPDKIILWLSKEQFSSITELPEVLRCQMERGLEICLVDGDYRSHKKYLYAFQEFPNDYVVLVDDDILYPSTFLKQLMQGMDKTKVHCSYGHLMTYGSQGNLLPYTSWKRVLGTDVASECFFFGAGGGTVFVPSALYPDVCNIDLAYKYCPTADDVWLNAMCKLANLRCCKVREGLIFPVQIENDQTLCSTNVFASQNDNHIKSLTEYYVAKLGLNPFCR